MTPNQGGGSGGPAVSVVIPTRDRWPLLADTLASALAGRGYVVPEDVKAIAPDVLRHRIALTYEAEADEVTADAVVTRVLDAVRVP